MNISPHLLIDAGILSTALTITLVLRAKGNAARKERESKWNAYSYYIAALDSPTAVNAESYWLILGYAHGVKRVQVESMAQCEEQGKIYSSNKGDTKGRVDQQRNWCIVGK